jgi:purine-cytosine permease-like protein
MSLRAKQSVIGVAVGLCLVLGTLGWFAVGFAVMTDCTNAYLCDETGCPPCDTTASWINVGGVSQLVLAAVGIAVLAVSGRPRRSTIVLSVAAACLLPLSLVVAVATTTRAQDSYCQPDGGSSAMTGEQPYC